MLLLMLRDFIAPAKQEKNSAFTAMLRSFICFSGCHADDGHAFRLIRAPPDKANKVCVC
jgi:hypothetical protein